jgi:TRAP-type uncharacterized transport system fused permease subunit
MIGSWPQILLAGGTAALGVVCLAAALQGWLLKRVTLVDRVMLLAAGLLFVNPRLLGDLIALVLLGGVLGLQTLRRPPEMAPAPAASLD